jgi:flagellar protein FlaG
MDNMNENLPNSELEAEDGDSLVVTNIESHPDFHSSKLFDTKSSKPSVVLEKSSGTDLKRLAVEISHSLSGFKSLRLSMDRDLQSVVVRVVDKDNDSVIRQIPEERMIDLVKQMKDLEGMLLKSTG